jgi:hypothetical protein
VVPLLSIFYLLGAVFIFENTGDYIGNRLILTLGVFAVIFTLPQIIDSMKPSKPSPTLADSLLSIIIIGTIVFTISSVISNSSVLRRKFPKGSIWLDGIAFFIVSAIVIFLLYMYSFNIIIWVIPMIRSNDMCGLGYGLLLRIFGLKISKPLIRLTRSNPK